MDERYIIGKTFIISEEQLNYLIDRNISSVKEWCYYNNFAGFEEEYPDHSFGFGWLSKEITGLPVHIILDESGDYVHSKHPMFLYAVVENNGNDVYVPILVHKFKPILLDEKYSRIIGEKTLDKVQRFIKVHYHIISEYANGRVEYRQLKASAMRKAINEGLLTEMPKFMTYIDIESLVQDDDKIVNVDFSSIGYNLLFNVDDKDISRKFIKELSKQALFDYADEITVKLNDFKLIGDPHTKSEVIKNAFYSTGKKLMVKVNFMESTKLERAIEYIDKNKSKKK